MDFDREQRPDGTPGEPSTGSPRSTDGSYDREFTGEAENGGDRLDETLHETLGEKLDETLDEGRERVSGKLEQGRERLSGVVDAGRNRLADQLEKLGDRIVDRADSLEDAGGAQARAGQVARRTGTALDSGADYLRTHDPAEMRDDLETAIRERPLLSVGMAVGAGFLLARILRD